MMSQDLPLPVQSTKAIVLLSGGLDSVVALVEAREVYDVVRVLTFDYGQRARFKELSVSRAIADYYNLPHEVVSLPWLESLLPKAMASSDVLEVGKTWKEPVVPNRISGVSDETALVWVPNRNGVFLNIAAAFAEALGAPVVVYGANEEEGRTFPDNTLAYRECLTEGFALSTLNRVRVETPVGHLNKEAIVRRGIELDAPLSRIWSCYNAGPTHCGVCPSCRLLQQALAFPEGEKIASLLF